jgi:hypothetical protein
MRTNALHFTLHAGASYAHPCRIARDVGKNVVWRRAYRTIQSPAKGERCGDHTGTTRGARVTATSRRTQSA